MNHQPTIESVAQHYIAATTVAPLDAAKSFEYKVDNWVANTVATYMPTKVEFSESFQYASYEAMREAVVVGNEPLIINTSNADNNPWLNKELNVRLRLLHDLWHLISDGDFSFEGEYKAYKAMANGLSMSHAEREFFFSEIVGQAAFYYYTGEFSDPQKVVLNWPFYWL